MLPLDLSQVVGIGYNEREGLIEMSRWKHDCIFVLFNVSRNMKEAVRCHYKPFQLLCATWSPQGIPEYTCTHYNLPSSCC